MAALMVALLHCLFAVGMPSELRERLLTGPAGAAANGGSAVILFFVLSGYVLARSFGREVAPRATAHFLAKRILRIYPAYVVAVAAAWLASFVYPALAAGPGAGSSLHEMMAAPPDAPQVLRHMLVPGMAGLLLPQGWTLPIELALSFALPALFLIGLRARGLLLFGAAAAGLVLGDARVVAYAFPFVLGMLASLHGRRRPRLGVPGEPGWSPTAALIVAAAAVLFFLPSHVLGSVSPDFAMAVVSGSAVAVLLGVRRSAFLRRIFGSARAARLGEISYGFYLLHFTVIALVAPLLFRDGEATTVTMALVRWVMLAAVVLPVAALLAAASWRWIEAPAIAAGRALARRPGGSRQLRG
jgi:peptidoglycan/LPS O-acetylase OafA/YrhL